MNVSQQLILSGPSTFPEFMGGQPPINFSKISNHDFQDEIREKTRYAKAGNVSFYVQPPDGTPEEQEIYLGKKLFFLPAKNIQAYFNSKIDETYYTKINIELYIHWDGNYVRDQFERVKDNISPSTIAIFIEIPDSDLVSDRFVGISVSNDLNKKEVGVFIKDVNALESYYSFSEEDTSIMLKALTSDPKNISKFDEIFSFFYGTTLKGLQKFNDAAKEIGLATIGIPVIDFLIDLAKSFEIPEKVWKSNLKVNQELAIQSIQDITTFNDSFNSVLNGYGNLLPNETKTKIKQTLTVVEKWVNIYFDEEIDITKLHIAFAAGVWNGTVELTVNILEVLKLSLQSISGVAKFVDSTLENLQDAEKFKIRIEEHLDNMFKVISEFDWSDFFKTIKDQFVQLFHFIRKLSRKIRRKLNRLNELELAYLFGGLLFMIVQEIIPYFKAAKTAKIARFLKKFGKFKQGVKRVIIKSKDELINLFKEIIRLFTEKGRLKELLVNTFNKIKVILKEDFGIKSKVTPKGNKLHFYNGDKTLSWSKTNIKEIRKSYSDKLNKTNKDGIKYKDIKLEDLISDPNFKDGTIIEAKVIKLLDDSGIPITRAGSKIRDVKTKRTIGDIDGATESHILEIKKSANGYFNKPKQMPKFTDPLNPDYLNPENKSVILFIAKKMTKEERLKVFQSSNSDIRIINDINDLISVLK